MLTRDGVIRLIDFGISRIAKDDSATDTNFLGTRGYAPPEQYGFGQTDARSDIYSLGVTAQRLLGKNYTGWMKKIITRCTKIPAAVDNPAGTDDTAAELAAEPTTGQRAAEQA